MCRPTRVLPDQCTYKTIVYLVCLVSAAPQIQIEKDFLASSFSILEHQPMDMLLGLDMLKRHQVSPCKAE